MSTGEALSVNRLRETIHHLGKSVEQVAKDLNLGKRTLYNYLYGKVVVPEELRPAFAAYLGCSQEFLFPHPSLWLSATSTFEGKQDVFPIPLHEQAEHAPKEEMDHVRRAILQQAMYLAGASFTLSSTSLFSVSFPYSLEEFFVQCATSMKSCWYLMRGKNLAIAEEVLATLMPTLMKAVAQPSAYQEIAARLLVEGYMIQSIAAKHHLNGVAREMFSQQAVYYSRLTGDTLLCAAASMFLGYTYLFCSPPKPQKAIDIFGKALHLLGTQAPLLKSDIAIGLADAYALCNEEKQAKTYISLALHTFRSDPEHDPSTLFADCALETVYQWEAKMYLDLASHHQDQHYYKQASEVVEKSVQQASFSQRCALETVVYQAEAARGVGNLELFAASLRKGVTMARELGSQLRYQDLLAAYRRTPSNWWKERPIQEIAATVFGQLPDGSAQ